MIVGSSRLLGFQSHGGGRGVMVPSQAASRLGSGCEPNGVKPRGWGQAASRVGLQAVGGTMGLKLL